MPERTKTWAVMAQYYTGETVRPFEGEYPRLMGFYEAVTPDEAFQQFVKEFAPDIRRAQIFYNEVVVIPCASADGYQFTMKSVFGELARFPNPDTLKDV